MTNAKKADVEVVVEEEEEEEEEHYPTRTTQKQ